MIAIDKKLLRADGTPSEVLLLAILNAHDAIVKKRLQPLYKLSIRDHDILNRTRLLGLPNNKLVYDFPRYITTMATGYLVGKPIQYKLPKEDQAAYKKLADALEKAKTDVTDAELAKNGSTYGKGVELCYTNEESDARSAAISPLFGFVVYDDTVEHNALFGITITVKTDETLKETGRQITLYTKTHQVEYMRSTVSNNLGSPVEKPGGRKQHYFGDVPMIEYWNNEDEIGDYEPVITLINAYDRCQSDRLNDKQQFTDAIMKLKGMKRLETNPSTVELDPADPDYAAKAANEDLKSKLTPSEYLAQTRTLAVPKDGDAEYLVKPDVEQANELLRKSFADDIHKISFVPDMTDEKFAGNLSGVAMHFKLLGLEQITGEKERWFREALKTRLKLYATILEKGANRVIDVDKIQISFSRNLPVNLLEVAQALQAFKDMVPDENLLSQVPFIEDADKAAKDMAAQRQQRAKESAMMFATVPLKDPADPKNQKPPKDDTK